MALSFIPFAFPGIPASAALPDPRLGRFGRAYGGGNIAYTVGDDPLRVSANRLDLAASLELAEIAELDQIHGDTLVFDPRPRRWSGSWSRSVWWPSESRGWTIPAASE